VTAQLRAQLLDVDNFARAFHLVMQGAVAHAEESDAEAAKGAQSMARDLIDKHYSSER
jgi:hypothetical protein